MSLMERASDSRALAHQPNSLTAGLRAVYKTVTRFISNRLAVRYMAELDDNMLKDIGLSRVDVDRAYMKPAQEDPMVELKQAASSRAQRMVI